MTMQKKPKPVNRVNLPDALSKKWKHDIVEDESALSQIATIRPTKSYSFGQLYINFSPGVPNQFPAILTVNHPNRLPTWDEIVYIRYNVCPDIEDMALILPSLDTYINYSHGRPKYTMTMEDITMRREMAK